MTLKHKTLKNNDKSIQMQKTKNYSIKAAKQGILIRKCKPNKRKKVKKEGGTAQL